MGLTCANIHVFTGDRQVGPQLADVGRVFDEACKRLGSPHVTLELDDGL